VNVEGLLRKVDLVIRQCWPDLKRSGMSEDDILKRLSEENAELCKAGLETPDAWANESEFRLLIHGRANQMGLTNSSREEFALSGTEKVRWTPNGIDLLTRSLRKDAGYDWRYVIRARMKPLSRLVVDGATFFEYDLDGRSRILKVDELHKLLKSEGSVVYQSRAMDVLSAVSREMARETKEVHATFGVYSETGGDLKICDNPIPVKDEQRRVWDSIESLLQRNAGPQDLRPYLEVLRFWHPYEVLPSLGAGLAAPFTPVLRDKMVLFPHVYNWAPESDLGKSLVAIIASQKLWGIAPTSGPAFTSAFRIAAQLDSSCHPIAVEEADRLDNRHWPVLKDSAERWLADKRGAKDLTVHAYHSRSVLLLTGNVMPITQGPVLKRFLIVRFDSAARRQRKKRSQELEDLSGRLAPIGYSLLRWFLEEHPSTADLLQMVDTYKQVIREQQLSWSSAKRPEAWACVYLGLKILETGCRRCDLDWRAPAIQEFYREVIAPVEGSTSDLKRSSVEAFSSWFAIWCINHPRRFTERGMSSGNIAGEDELFRSDVIRVGKEEIEGHWITKALLDLFNDETDDVNRISTHVELAKQAADLAGLPYSEVLDADRVHVKNVKIGGKAMRAAFVPTPDYFDRRGGGNQVTLDGPDSVTDAQSATGNPGNSVTTVTTSMCEQVTTQPYEGETCEVTELPESRPNANESPEKEEDH